MTINGENNQTILTGEVNQTNKCIEPILRADGALTQEEKGEIRKHYLEEKQNITNYTKSCLSNFVKTESLSEKSNNGEIGGDLGELLNISVEEVLHKIAGELNSSEGASFDTDSIYEQVGQVLDSMSGKIEETNIFKKNIQVVKENFLLPKEKGIQFIQYIINKLIIKEKAPINLDTELDNAFILLKSTFGTLLDLGKILSNSELESNINELKHIPYIKNLLESIPDLENILIQLLNTLGKITNKETLMSALDILYTSLKGDILYLMEGKLKENDIKKSNEIKLHIAEATITFIDSMTTVDSLNVLIKTSSEFNIIKKTPLFSHIYELLLDENITPEDRYKLFQGFNKMVLLFANKESSEEEINKNINSFSQLLAKLGTQIPEQKVKPIIMEFLGQDTQMDTGVETKISYTQIAKLIWDNKSEFVDIIDGLINGLIKNTEDLVAFLIKGDVLGKNIKYANGKLIERMRVILGVDIQSIVGGIRSSFLEQTGNLTNINIKLLTVDTRVLKGNDFLNIVFGGLEKRAKEVLLDKLNSKTGQNLTKKEISETILISLREIIQNNKKEFIRFLEASGVKIEENQEELITKFIDSILKSEKIKLVIEKLLTQILTKISNSDNIAGELNLLLKQTIETSGQNMLEDTSKSIIIDTGIDSFYDIFLHSKESIQTLFKLLKINIPLNNIALQDATYIELIQIFKKYISKEKIQTIIQAHPEFLHKELNSENIKQVGAELYLSLDNKFGLIQDISNSGIIKDIQSMPEGTTDISDSDIGLTIDLIYNTIHTGNPEKTGEIIHDILDKFGLLNNILGRQKIGGHSLGENLVLFLNSIQKEDLKHIIIKNKSALLEGIKGDFPNGEEIDFITKIGEEIFSKLDIEHIQKVLGDNNATPIEALSIDLLDEVQNFSKNNPGEISRLASHGKDLHMILKERKIEIKAGTNEAKNIQKYGEDLFSMIHQIILQLDENYLEKNIIIPNFQEGNPHDNDFLTHTLIWSIIGNNKGFGLRNLFDIMTSNIGRLTDDYFRDPSNKDNFGETTVDFIINYTRKS